jgi:hypothetical protein
MNHNTRKNTYRFELILIVVAILFSSLACSLGGVSIKGGKASIDLRLSEKDINSMVVRSISQLERGQEDLLTSVSKVSIQDGFIRVYGTTFNALGQEVKGSFDVELSVEDNKLGVHVSAVDMPGVTLYDPRIVKANRALARGISTSVKDSHGDMKFIQAEVLENVVHLQIQLLG